MKTTEDTRRYPVVRHIKISREMNAEIVRRAQEDERPIAAYIRRALARVLEDGRERERT